MRKHIISFTLFTLLMFAAGIAAADNKSTIDQEGDHNGAAVMQKKDDNNAAIEQNKVYPGGHNKAFIKQSGYNQYGTITQNGSHNKGKIIQGDGADDVTATITQTGDDNEAKIKQRSRDNEASIVQDQFGYDGGNKASIDQSVSSQNFADILQIGSGNEAKIRQNSLLGHETSLIVQYGDGNKAFIDQASTLGDNDSTIFQTGAYNRALIKIGQGAGYNNSLIDQMGDDNEAFIGQTGSDNYATIMQSGVENKGEITQEGTESPGASIDQSGFRNQAVIRQFKDSYGLHHHRATIVQGGSDIYSSDNVAVLYQGSADPSVMHEGTIYQDGVGNEANMAQTQGTVADMATITQNGMDNLAISIQGEQPDPYGNWKLDRPKDRNIMAPMEPGAFPMLDGHS